MRKFQLIPYALINKLSELNENKILKYFSVYTLLSVVQEIFKLDVKVHQLKCRIQDVVITPQRPYSLFWLFGLSTHMGQRCGTLHYSQLSHSQNICISQTNNRSSYHVARAATSPTISSIKFKLRSTQAWHINIEAVSFVMLNISPVRHDVIRLIIKFIASAAPPSLTRAEWYARNFGW